MVLELKDLHTLARLVLADKVQTGGVQAVDVFGIDLVAVTVSLLDLVGPAVEGADLGPLAARLEDGLARPEAHGAAHVLLVELGHGDDDVVAGGGVELLGVGAGQGAKIARELDGGGLESEANLQSYLAPPRSVDGCSEGNILPRTVSGSLARTWMPTSFPPFLAYQIHQGR